MSNEWLVVLLVNGAHPWGASALTGWRLSVQCGCALLQEFPGIGALFSSMPTHL